MVSVYSSRRKLNPKELFHRLACGRLAQHRPKMGAVFKMPGRKVAVHKIEQSRLRESPAARS
jgi:hypothetical protein